MMGCDFFAREKPCSLVMGEGSYFLVGLLDDSERKAF
jgi:hypothetical protein